MDGGSFYSQGVSLSRSAVPGMNYPFPSGSFEPAATSRAAGAPFLEIGVTQKLDHIVSLFKEQVKETATIKEELAKVWDERDKVEQQVLDWVRSKLEQHPYECHKENSNRVVSKLLQLAQ